jgi:TonB family protein
MRGSRNSTNAGVILAMIVASVIVHLVLWPVGDKVMKYGWGAPPIPVSSGVFEVSLVPTEPAPEDEDLDLPDPVERENNQVKFPGELVQLDDVTNETKPDDAKFISEFDSDVEKQTKATNMRRPPGQDPRPGQETKTDGSDERSESTAKSDTSKALPLGRVPNDVEGGQPMDAADAGDLASGEEPRPPVGALSPRIGDSSTAAAMRKTFGGPSSIDHAEGVEEGEATMLDSVRWKYASFFNRVRNAIDEEWEPQEVHKAHDPEGRTFGTRTRRTQLVIRLNPDGSIARVRLDHPSGAPHLDEEAIRAVRAAAPFVNPPPGLVDPDTGFIEFGFGFIFEFEGKRRIFRYSG